MWKYELIFRMDGVDNWYQLDNNLVGSRLVYMYTKKKNRLTTSNVLVFRIIGRGGSITESTTFNHTCLWMWYMTCIIIKLVHRWWNQFLEKIDVNMNSSTNHNDSLKRNEEPDFFMKKNCSGNIIWFYAKAKRPDTPPVAFMCYPTTTIAAKILGRRYRSYQIYRAVNPPTSMLWVQWDLRIGPQFNLNVCYKYYFIRKSKIYCHS